jgi:hypothetical protein
MNTNSDHLGSSGSSGGTAESLSEAAPRAGEHRWDEDCVCVNCGFDGAEWWHWRHMTYEGKASTLKQPLCRGDRFAA